MTVETLCIPYTLPDGRSAEDLIVTAGLDEGALVNVVVARSASEGGGD